jgi:hypothetical protein
MRTEEARVQPNAGNPLADEPGVLARRYRAALIATTAKRNSPGFLWVAVMAVYRLSGLFRHFKLDRLARLLLTHRRPIDRMTMGSNVF